jgi:hypothetical protein
MDYDHLVTKVTIKRYKELQEAERKLKLIKKGVALAQDKLSKALLEDEQLSWDEVHAIDRFLLTILED